MFEVLVYAVVIVGVLAFCGEQKPAAVETIAAVEETLIAEVPAVAEVSEVLEIAATFTADEVITHQAKPNYEAMSIQELKALGKQHNIPGWKAWKKPQTAIARLEALAA